MDSPLRLQIIIEELQRHWVSGFFVLLSLSTVVIVLALRWWWRRRWRRLMEQELDQDHELDLMAPLGDKDHQALAILKETRARIWQLPESELKLSIEALSGRAAEVVRSMAAVYHPQAESPEYEASLIESLQLANRVVARLSRLASVRPLSFFGNRRLSEYQRYYEVYRKINENPVLVALKRHRHLYRVARWALHLKNIGNPLYWAGKEISREGYFFMIRWYYAILVSQVGKEAMRLYSGRRFHREEERDAVLICHRLFALTHRWGGPSGDEWVTLLDLVTTATPLDSEAKLKVLTRWTQHRIPKDLDRQPLQTRWGMKWYREALNRLLAEDDDLQRPPLKEECIREELDALDATVEAAKVSEAAEPAELAEKGDQPEAVVLDGGPKAAQKPGRSR